MLSSVQLRWLSAGAVIAVALVAACNTDNMTSNTQVPALTLPPSHRCVLSPD